MKPVRTRFAPSPTGFLHVGGVRTALFAWLVARQASGKFILRIEDTDKNREVAESEQHIIASLKWLGIDWDEGPDKEGDFGPYKQSSRLANYKVWALKLIEIGRAYADPYSVEELEAFRQEAHAQKKPFLFRNHRPANPPEWDGTQPLRFKSDPKSYSWHDAVMGDLKTGPEVVDDFIIIKSDGYPTYNFAHIVDDYEMQITHVIRSQEFIASVPKFLNMYEALEIERPILATVPFVMSPEGHKKLGKRDGAKDILDYKREGYLPEALVNFMALLGWNDGTEQEIFTIKELIDKFDLSRVQRSGAKFDDQRLLWMSGTYIRAMNLDRLVEEVKDFWPHSADNFDSEYKKRVLVLVQDRLKFFAELPALTSFFFEDLPMDNGLIGNNKNLQSLDKDKLIGLLTVSMEDLSDIVFKTQDLTTQLNNLLIKMDSKPAVLFSLLRIATTQAPFSPGLAETLGVLGKERSISRIKQQIEALRNS
jgi:glutamyl-tRNA synthetase